MVYAVVFGLHVEAATPTVLRAYPMEPNPVFQAVVTVWYYHPGRTPAVLRAYISNTPFEIVQTQSGAELSLGPSQLLTHQGGCMPRSDSATGALTWYLTRSFSIKAQTRCGVPRIRGRVAGL